MSTDYTLLTGEALAGKGNEVAHIDLMIGNKAGPVGHAYASALARQSEGHTNLLAVLTPNMAVKPSAVMITKVTLKKMGQVIQMFGPAQRAVAQAIAESVKEGVIPKDDADNLVMVVGVFIHPAATDDVQIFAYNYEATKLAIANAIGGKPTAAEMVTALDSKDHEHPFQGGFTAADAIDALKADDAGAKLAELSQRVADAKAAAAQEQPSAATAS